MWHHEGETTWWVCKILDKVEMVFDSKTQFFTAHIQSVQSPVLFAQLLLLST